MTNQKITKTPYIIRLIVNEKNSGTYRVSKDLFITIKNLIKPYQSFKNKPKKVKCVETGEIFKNAKAANDMLIKKKGFLPAMMLTIGLKRYATKEKKLLMVYIGSLLIRDNKFLIYAKIKLWI